jgi:uncharacterized membrane protein
VPSRSRIVLSGFFLAAGALHFVKPRPYESIMPERLPAHRELVEIPEPLLWARLPLQAAIVYWIWRVAVRRGPTSAATPR